MHLCGQKVVGIRRCAFRALRPPAVIPQGGWCLTACLGHRFCRFCIIFNRSVVLRTVICNKSFPSISPHFWDVRPSCHKLRYHTKPKTSLLWHQGVYLVQRGHKFRVRRGIDAERRVEQTDEYGARKVLIASPAQSQPSCKLAISQQQKPDAAVALQSRMHESCNLRCHTPQHAEGYGFPCFHCNGASSITKSLGIVSSHR